MACAITTAIGTSLHFLKGFLTKKANFSEKTGKSPELQNIAPFFKAPPIGERQKQKKLLSSSYFPGCGMKNIHHDYKDLNLLATGVAVKGLAVKYLSIFSRRACCPFGKPAKREAKWADQAKYSAWPRNFQNEGFFRHGQNLHPGN